MTDFSAQALSTLQGIFDDLESREDLDVEGNEMHFSVTLPSKQTFLIYFHSIAQQIWVASPISGAHHFHYQEGVWRSTRSEMLLINLLACEIS